MNRRGFLGTLAALVGTLSLKAKEPKSRLAQHAEARQKEIEVLATGDNPSYARLYRSSEVFEEHFYSDGLSQIKIERLGKFHPTERQFRLVLWTFESEPVRLREEGKPAPIAIGFQKCHVLKIWQRECDYSCGPACSV